MVARNPVGLLWHYCCVYGLLWHHLIARGHISPTWWKPLKNAYSGTSRDNSLERLFRAVEVYRRYTDSHSILFFEMFLLVASRTPIGPTEIARLLDTPQAVVTGGLSTLGEKRAGLPERYVNPANLVSLVDHPADARKRLAGLTPKGGQLVAELRAALGTP